MSVKNIDSMLQEVRIEEETGLKPEPIQEIEQEAPSHESNEENNHQDATEHQQEVNEDSEQHRIDESSQQPSQNDDNASEFDEYGNKIDKKGRVYTQEEVNAMLRDRNSRGEFAKQEAERIRQEAIREYQESLRQQQNQEINSESGEDWKQEFESLVVETLSKHEQRQRQILQQQELARQNAEFAIKFNKGAEKYPDFEGVVAVENLTPDMIFATRGMSDPAAFLYAASKTQTQELQRISRLNDPYVQAVELGKLEERMRKAKYVSSNSPKPVSQVRGDVSTNEKPMTIDDKLRIEEAKRRKGLR